MGDSQAVLRRRARYIKPLLPFLGVMMKYPHLDKKERQMAIARGFHQWCDDLPDEFSPENEREEDLVKAGVPIKEIERLREIRG